MKFADQYRRMTERLSPKQRQYLNLALLAAAGFGALWVLFSFSDSGAKPRPTTPPPTPSAVTNLGVITPGTQVTAQDLWVGTAGRKLAQYEQDKENQHRMNADRQAFEETMLKRMGELESRLAAPGMPPNAPPASPAAPPAPSAAGRRDAAAPAQVPTGAPAFVDAAVDEAASMTRVALALPERSQGAPTNGAPSAPREPSLPHIDSFLPIGFVKADLLGGLDAPTGGQAQSNPHPVLLRLADTAVLPNQFRGDIKECFVIGAGYGDISSERAFIRTETLSCVRKDGAVIEVKIQGSVFGEDGKAGVRGRLVQKQGQLLANALLAGAAGGIGQGFANSGTTYTTSALGTVATMGGDMREQMRRGIGTGTGRALDMLANYYIKLAEQTFPVIEVGAGRHLEVVITRGVRIDGGGQGFAQTDAKGPAAAPLPQGGANGQD
ncbi:TraB/VirB10 family protein [Massilia sp. TS11]|uniref:TraB/VirB10 family protein n=1 Tax=Massilia sp. TS11 TaxID=2908003 RepID=UPI001EDBCF4A|nr:TraB/VirB10 family protein [Massilia sp. TS11]MCG2583890.1 TraB/VirB10 family protein [Massilia sp. TS11]